MKETSKSVYNVTPSGLNMFAFTFHNYYIPSGLKPGDQSIRKNLSTSIGRNKKLTT
jgi:hypothetical protein